MSAESDLRAERSSTRKRKNPAVAERALEELREVLTRPALDRMERIERKLAAGGIDAAAVASHLPRATAMVQGNQEFARALAPTVEDAIQVSVRKNPQPLVDAIFPIIGPAIRRSIQTALAGMTEGLNASLESGFKLKGVRRWLQAKRTGRSVGEIALLESLVYRVEQVMWIENETGLLLANVSDPGLTTRDPDLVSSMLSALQDYVGDSFGDENDAERTQLQEIEFGEQQLAIFRGPRSSLAALVRGRASSEWRISAEELLERLHLGASEELAEFDGDVEPFRSWEGELETVLDERQRERKRSYATQIIVAAIVAFGIFASVREFNLRQELKQSWSAVVQRFESEPGIRVLTKEIDGKAFSLSLLRDPLARTDDAVLAGLSAEERERIVLRNISHTSSEPLMVQRRARISLAPPTSVNLIVDGTRLVLEGEASHRWIVRSLQRASGMPGIDTVDHDALIDRDVLVLEAALDRLRSENVQTRDQARDTLWKSLNERVREVDALAQQAGALIRISVVGVREDAEPLAQALSSPDARRVFVSTIDEPEATKLTLRVEATALDDVVSEARNSLPDRSE